MSDISQLRLHAHVSSESRLEAMWDFDVSTASVVTTYFQEMKHLWRRKSGLEFPEEWTHLILPPGPEPDAPWRWQADLNIWAPLSLLTTIISPVALRLCLVSTAELLERSPLDDKSPHFPLHSPPTIPHSRFINGMVDLLLCKDPILATYYLGLLLTGASNCQLKMEPDVRFPEDFGGSAWDIQPVFALVPEWNPTTEAMIQRSGKAPLCLSSPALVLGIQLEDDSGDFRGLTSDDFAQLARATQPHLEALLVARQQRPIPTPTSPSNPPDCVFALAFRNKTVFIVAHIAYLHQSTCRYQSLLLDELPLPSYVSGDEAGVLARLRATIAVLTIRSHADRLAADWGDISWPQKISTAELALLRECTGIATPNPSDYVDRDRLIWGDMLDDVPFEDDGAELDVNPPASEIAKSKELVDGWLPGTQAAKIVEPDTVNQEFIQTARASQPHLEALLVAQHQCHSKLLPATRVSECLPAHRCIFGLVLRDATLLIIAHVPYTHNGTYRYHSLLVDELAFPVYAEGDSEGLLARLRVIIALLTIQNHADRLASLWDAVVWTPTIIDAELALARECTGIVTPNPSDYEDNEALLWGDLSVHIGFADGYDTDDVDPAPFEIANSKEKVNRWLDGVVLEDIPS
ncbi:hypothetical protein C8R46DRAFT_1345159 [Mycena filopes]|nr:hypothetical protein C8R46DRAFT_1345159 [Mycena filopes]